MNCLQVDNLIQTSLDRVLTLSEKERLADHLETCAGCRAAWNEHPRLARLAGRWVAEAGGSRENGDVFTAQVLAQITSRPAPVSPSAPLWGHPLAAMGLLLAALALLPLSVWPDLPTVGASAHALPGWLLANGRALPADMAAIWATAQSGLVVPSWLWSALLVAGAVNGLFYARLTQSRRKESVS